MTDKIFHILQQETSGTMISDNTRDIEKQVALCLTCKPVLQSQGYFLTRRQLKIADMENPPAGYRDQVYPAHLSWLYHQQFHDCMRNWPYRFFANAYSIRL